MFVVTLAVEFGTVGTDHKVIGLGGPGVDKDVP
jgi:hypothetical protein